MEHDGCVGCKYETTPGHSEPCVQCCGNYIDRYTPAKVWDTIRRMDDRKLMKFLEKCREAPEKSLQEVLDDVNDAKPNYFVMAQAREDEEQAAYLAEWSRRHGKK